MKWNWLMVVGCLGGAVRAGATEPPGRVTAREVVRAALEERIQPPVQPPRFPDAARELVRALPPSAATRKAAVERAAHEQAAIQAAAHAGQAQLEAAGREDPATASSAASKASSDVREAPARTRATEAKNPGQGHHSGSPLHP